MLSARDVPYQYFHLATEDYLSVTEIADMVVAEMGLSSVRYEYTGGDRGWRGDVPVVRFDISKARAHGWRARRSAQEAMRAAIRAMVTSAAD
jgi:UDP-glucose 4-epimerase